MSELFCRLMTFWGDGGGVEALDVDVLHYSWLGVKRFGAMNREGEVMGKGLYLVKMGLSGC